MCVVEPFSSLENSFNRKPNKSNVNNGQTYDIQKLSKSTKIFQAPRVAVLPYKNVRCIRKIM